MIYRFSYESSLGVTPEQQALILSLRNPQPELERMLKALGLPPIHTVEPTVIVDCFAEFDSEPTIEMIDRVWRVIESKLDFVSKSSFDRIQTGRSLDSFSVTITLD